MAQMAKDVLVAMEMFRLRLGLYDLLLYKELRVKFI